MGGAGKDRWKWQETKREQEQEQEAGAMEGVCMGVAAGKRETGGTWWT